MARLVLAAVLLASCGGPFFSLPQSEQRAFIDTRGEVRRACGPNYFMDYDAYATTPRAERAAWLDRSRRVVTSAGTCCRVGCACGASCIACSDMCHH